MERVSRFFRRVMTGALLAASLLSTSAAAETEEGRMRYEPVTPRSHEFIESFRYVTILYFLTLGGYLYISHNEIFSNASLQNYARNFGNITLFDQDLPSSNWGVHLATGAVSFEFYRARQYTLEDSFFLTLIQECLFQFTVETLIQPTALENVVDTAIVGSVLGRGLEVASLPLLNSDNGIFRALGYLFNIPAALGLYQDKVRLVPIAEGGRTGAELQVRF